MESVGRAIQVNQMLERLEKIRLSFNVNFVFSENCLETYKNHDDDDKEIIFFTT